MCHIPVGWARCPAWQVDCGAPSLSHSAFRPCMPNCRACPAPCSMPNGRWRAQFTHRNKVIQIGMYDAEEEVRGAPPPICACLLGSVCRETSPCGALLRHNSNLDNFALRLLTPELDR